jgi:hypothetical protein
MTRILRIQKESSGIRAEFIVGRTKGGYRKCSDRVSKLEIPRLIG